MHISILQYQALLHQTRLLYLVSHYIPDRIKVAEIKTVKEKKGEKFVKNSSLNTSYCFQPRSKFGNEQR